MFYTTIAGWMLYYFYGMLTGKFVGADSQQVTTMFSEMTSSPLIMIGWMIFVVILGFGICSMGLQKGVEKITKVMMISLLFIMLILAVHSIFLKGGQEGLSFYLLPDFKRMVDIGIGETIVNAMNQAFFTLSLGIGSMAIFGSYQDKSHSLLGEAVNIAVLDTFVAFVAGLIIFPACFAFQVNPDSGPRLIFITLPNIFNEMVGGRIWGSLFFLFMSFAALSTVIAVFENIMSFGMDLWGWSRKKGAIINVIIVILGSIPCILGFNLWAGFHPLGAGSNVLDLEDFLVSNLFLPFGSFIYTLFCVSRYGWGWDNYIEEVNAGKGLKVSCKKAVKIYLKYVLPFILIIILLQGLIDKFF